MDAAAFELQIRGEGFSEAETRKGTPEFASKPHTHPFAVRALILAGEFTLTRDGTPQTYRAGDTFAMDAECVHTEQFGAEGSTYLIARKHPPAKG